MLYENTQSSTQPSRVALERHPAGKTIVRMTDNVREVQTEDGVVVTYDEVVFDLPEDRTGETVASITANFAAWWEYGTQPVVEITLEQRVADLEDFILAMMGE